MTFNVETEQDVDGRWIAEVTRVPGALAYGNTRQEAIARAEAIALQVLAARTASSNKVGMALRGSP